VGDDVSDDEPIMGELLHMEPMQMSSLSVSVDYLELVERVGESEAWIVLGKLKDLLG
jgi:hypothetical protein